MIFLKNSKLLLTLVSFLFYFCVIDSQLTDTVGNLGDMARKRIGSILAKDRSNTSSVRFFLNTHRYFSERDREELFLDEVEILNGSSFERGADTIFIAHGYKGSTSQEFPIALIRALARAFTPINILVLDWSSYSGGGLKEVALASLEVAAKSAEFVNFLVTQKYVEPEFFHCIGFSVGAHICGNLGSNFEMRQRRKIGRISGLNPTKAYFGLSHDMEFDEKRLDPSDAIFVDVIHSETSTIGFLEPRGHIDFYPNGGNNQPGCKHLGTSASCAHFRAYELYTESLIYKDAPDAFLACSCKNWNAFTNGQCSPCKDTAKMGHFASPTSKPGIYYCYTSSNSPFHEIPAKEASLIKLK